MLLIGLWLAVLPCCLLAQQNKLSIGPVQAISVKAGGTVEQNLKLVVIPGFHVNNDKPKDEFLIPLKLTWTDGPLQAKSITYPQPEEIKVGSQMLTVFTGTFLVKTEFQAVAGAKPGSGVMNGKLRYQACNNDMCFRPATLDVRVPVNVE